MSKPLAILRARRLKLACGALALALVAGVTTAAGGSSGGKPLRGTETTSSLTVTLHGSGTVQPAEKLTLDFPSQGRLTSVRAQVGQHVSRGQELAQIDATAARGTLLNALSALASARARLAQLQGHETPQDHRQDGVTLAQGKLAVQQAQQALADTEAQIALDEQTLQAALDKATAKQASDVTTLDADKTALDAATAAVATAKEKVTAAQSTLTADSLSQTDVQQQESDHQAQLSNDQEQLSTDEAALQQAQQAAAAACPGPSCGAAQAALKKAQAAVNADRAAVANDRGELGDDASHLTDASKAITRDSAALSSAQSALSDAQAALGDAKAAVQADEGKLESDASAVEAAQQAVDSGRLKDDQTRHNAANSVANAELALASVQASQEAKLHPAKPGDIASAAAALAAARAAVAQARADVDHTILRAPVSGVVSSVNARVGETAGSGNAGEGGFVGLVADGSYELSASFGEVDAAKLRAGQRATVTVRGLDNASLPAHVVSIDPLGTAGKDGATFTVTFVLDGAPRGILAGMTASVALTVGVGE